MNNDIKILNVMSSKNLGGIEQAFIDYNTAFSQFNYKVYAFYHKKGKIKEKIKNINAKNINFIGFNFFKPYFLILPFLFIQIYKIKPNLIICHTRKILFIFKLVSFFLKIPLVFVAHNEKINHLNCADFIFSTTEYQKEIFIKNNFIKEKIFVIPNMLTFKKQFYELDKYHTPPILGVIGRFDPMKGFSLFVSACNILKKKGIKFIAKIAGSPQIKYMKEYEKIIKAVKDYNLQEYIEFTGWIENKDDFYNNIDIFILPSIYEPFGIVLLEAMMYSKPIISSLQKGGVTEMLKNNDNAFLVFENTNVDDLADKIEKLIFDINLAKFISKNGYDLVNNTYSIDSISKILDTSIKNILNI